MLEDRREFKEFCTKLLDKYQVNRDEAHAGVLGFHPLALLVVALDHIKDLEDQLSRRDEE
jgi:hypothetical protein